MIKLSQKVLSGLGKVPPMKSKARILGEDVVNNLPKKMRKKIGGGHHLRLKELLMVILL